MVLSGFSQVICSHHLPVFSHILSGSTVTLMAGPDNGGTSGVSSSILSAPVFVVPLSHLISQDSPEAFVH